MLKFTPQRIYVMTHHTINLTAAQVTSLENDTYANILTPLTITVRSTDILDIRQFYGMTTKDQIMAEVIRQYPRSMRPVCVAICDSIAKAILPPTKGN